MHNMHAIHTCTVPKHKNHIIGVAFSAAKGLDLAWCKAPDSGLPAPDMLPALEELDVCAVHPDFLIALAMTKYVPSLSSAGAADQRCQATPLTHAEAHLRADRQLPGRHEHFPAASRGVSDDGGVCPIRRGRAVPALVPKCARPANGPCKRA